jgi:hypothetical protein
MRIARPRHDARLFTRASLCPPAPCAVECDEETTAAAAGTGLLDGREGDGATRPPAGGEAPTAGSKRALAEHIDGAAAKRANRARRRDCTHAC